MAGQVYQLAKERLDQLKGRHTRLTRRREDVETELATVKLEIAQSNQQIAELELWLAQNPEES